MIKFEQLQGSSIETFIEKGFWLILSGSHISVFVVTEALCSCWVFRQDYISDFNPQCCCS